MPPKRPRIVPSQTDLSVQDVRDYSTPEGAAMANEEMRRLKMALQATREQVDTAAGSGQGGGAGAAGTATAEQYIWSISINSELVGEAVPTGTKVNFIAGEGVTITRNGPNITISAVADMSWMANADSGSINVPSGSLVRFTGINGVSTTADTGTKSIIINRPLQIKRRGIEIGAPDTVSLDFWVEHSHHDPKATEHVYFEVFDLGDGERRIKGWVTPGSYTWNFITDTNVPETVDDTEQVSFIGGANVTVTNVGNVITISANAAAGTLQLQQEGVNIGPNDTAVINWDNATALKPAGYTSRVWTEVINDGGGVRRLIAWYEPGSGGSYYWNLQANGGAIEQIDNAETVNFAAAGNLTVARVGNTITYSYTAPATYSWFVSANYGASEEITTGETLTFANGLTTQWTRAGSVLTVQRPLQIQNDTTSVGANDTMQMDFNSSTSTSGVYNTPIRFLVQDLGAGARRIIGYYRQGLLQYSWQLSTVNQGAVTVGDGAIVSLTGLNGVSINRSGTNVTVDRPLQIQMTGVNVGDPNTTVLDFRNATPTKPVAYTGQVYFDVVDMLAGNRRVFGWYEPGAGVYSWTASDGANTAAVTNGETVVITGATGVTVSLNVGTQTYTVSRPLQIKDDGVNVGDTSTTAINYDSNGGTGTSYIEWEIADVGGNERRVRGKYNAGAGTYVWSASDNTTTEQITNTEVVKWVGAKGVNVVLNAGTQTFTIDRALQLRDDGVNVGNDSTTIINFDSNGSTGATYIEWELADVAGVRQVRGKYSAGAGAYSWTASDGPVNLAVGNGEEITWLGDGGVSVGLDILSKTFTINRPLQLRDDGINVGNDETTIINYDSNGATGTNYIEWELADVAGVRQVRGKYAPSVSTYNWLLAASGTPNTDTITSGETVTFIGQAGIRVTRSGSSIIIEPNPDDPPQTSDGKRVLTGEITFSQATADYLGATPAFMYGTRLYVDIVHNWNLSNFNNFHLELIDRALDDVAANVQYYRSGAGAISGVPDLGPQRFRNFPHWAGFDRNTIRVWATMSRLKPTPMKFRYTLVEL